MTRTFSRAGVLSINPPVLALHGIVFSSVAVTAVERHRSREAVPTCRSALNLLPAYVPTEYSVTQQYYSRSRRPLPTS